MRCYYQSGDVIFLQGDVAHFAYIIEYGKVEIHIEDEVVETLQKGDLFGEMGILDQQPRSTSARALGSLVLLQVEAKQITERLSQADPIIKSLLHVLLRRFRSLLPHEKGFNPNTLLSKVESLVEESGLSKIKLESELKNAIENDEIQTVFQPINRINSGKVAGFEVLSRWQHPTKGMIPPFEFITLAEETRLILEAGHLVFKQACELLTRLPDQFFVSVNVSPRQLDNDDFLNQVTHMMKQHSINPDRLSLEITETIVVDTDAAKKWIAKCKELGFSVCVDDFGTGYSGIQQLVEMDFDVLKVDQTFIKNMFENQKYSAVIQSIARLAADLEIIMVAEGVEHEYQYRALKLLGFNYGQGYYFGKPMSAEQALSIIE